MKLSIIIPCYNEGKNIPLILDRFAKVINREDIEVILVDNNSQDNTAEIFSEALLKYKFVRSIFEKEAGYGSAILAGFRIATGEYIGWTHADMQTDPKDCIQGLEIIEKNNNPENIYVKGKRCGRPFFDLFFSFGMGIFETLYLRKIFFEINAQPNIFHRTFIKKWENPPKDFSFDLYTFYLAKINYMRIIRFPVFFPKRIHGNSSWNTGFISKWKFIKRTIKFSRELKLRVKKYKP